MDAGNPANARANNFDFIRFLLASTVILSHANGLPGGVNNDWFTRAMGRQMTAGTLAVYFFFVLSGFLIVRSWEHSRTTTDFVIKRALRIYPGFFASIAFCVFIVGPLGSLQRRGYFTTFQHYKLFEMLLLHPPVLIHGVFTDLAVPAVNGSLWTIPFELVCYAEVLLLGRIGALRRHWTVALLFVMAYAANKASPNWELNLPIVGLIGQMVPLSIYFLSGSVFYLFQHHIPHHRWLLVSSILVILASHSRGLNWTLPIFGTYVIFYVAFSRSFRMHRFGRRGDFSYGLYLYSYPIQQLLIQRLGRGIHPLVLFALSLIITLALAVVSWHRLEKPFLRLKCGLGGAPAEVILPAG